MNRHAFDRYGGAHVRGTRMGVRRVWLTNRTGAVPHTTYATRLRVPGLERSRVRLCVRRPRGTLPLALAVNEQSNGSTFFLFRSLLSFLFPLRQWGDTAVAAWPTMTMRWTIERYYFDSLTQKTQILIYYAIVRTTYYGVHVYR